MEGGVDASTATQYKKYAGTPDGSVTSVITGYVTRVKLLTALSHGTRDSVIVMNHE